MNKFLIQLIVVIIIYVLVSIMIEKFYNTVPLPETDLTKPIEKPIDWQCIFQIDCDYS
jgi:hypothetical protein